MFDVVVAPCFFGFGLQQRLTVCKGDLVVVGMNFGKGQKSVAVTAVVDEGGLQRRLHSGDLRQIDIAADLLLMFRLEVELFYAVPAYDNDARLLGVRRIDKHFLCHLSCAPRRTSGTGDRPASLGRLPNTSEGAPDMKVPVWRRRWCSSQTTAGTCLSRGRSTSDRYC